MREPCVLDTLNLPSGWRWVRLDRCLSRSREHGRPELQPLSVFLDAGVIPRSGREDNHNRLGEDLSRYLVVQPGYFVFNKLRTWQGGFGSSLYSGIVSPAYFVCHSDESQVVPRFVDHLLHSSPYLAELTRRSKWMPPSQFDIPWEELKSLPLMLPSLKIQRSIVEFIDRKISGIESLIRKKERLIELLQKKQQALISHAVTKGLDPEVPMKDSRVPWFGLIPADWQVLPLRRVVDEFIDYRGRTPTKVDEGVPLITAGAVRDGRIDHSRAPEFMAAEEYEEFMRRGLPRRGDLVFTTEAPLGEVALVEDPSAAFAQRIILFRMNPRRMTSEYLWLFYQSSAGRDEVQSRGSGSTAEGIRADRLRASAVLVPPIAAQKMIVDVVTREMRKIEPLRATIKTQVERLKEYRQVLISAAVTGQLDIRSVGAA